MSLADRRFGFLAFPRLEELDLIGPWEMVGVWRTIAAGPSQTLIVARDADPVTCSRGLTITPHATFADCPQLDYLLIPGGMGTRTLVNDAGTVEFVRRQAAGCRAVLSVCTGSFVLRAAGLLAGRRATTHWGSLKRLGDAGDVQVVEERYVRDGNVWTSAGVSAGIDMTLRFIAEEAGEDVAGEIQLYAEYFPDPVAYGSARTQAGTPGYARKR